MGFYAVADGNDDIERVVLDLVGFAVGGSCCKKRNNCRRLQFSPIKNVLNMARDGGLIALEEIRDLAGGEPDGLIDQTHVDARLSVFRLEKENLAGVVHIKACPRECLGD